MLFFEKNIYLAAADVKTRMESLRTVFRKIWKKKPSGSATQKMTATERDIYQKCRFLEKHLKSRDSINNIQRQPNSAEVQ